MKLFPMFLMYPSLPLAHKPTVQTWLAVKVNTIFSQLVSPSTRQFVHVYYLSAYKSPSSTNAQFQQ